MKGEGRKPLPTMSCDITIRPLGVEDLPEAAALLCQLNPDCPADTVLERFSTILADHAHYQAFGAFTTGLSGPTRLVGIASAWTATKVWCGKYLEIDNLVVAQSHRSSGIGSRLIEVLEARARETGCAVVVLDSYTSNHPSHRLYHRLGFEIWGYHFIKPIGNWSGKPA